MTTRVTPLTINLARALALLAHLALIGLILAWTTWWGPPEIVPIWLALTLLALPLLLPLRGILQGRLYTHAWASLLALAYITLGITLGAAAETRLYGIQMTIASLAWFSGCLLYVKLSARQARAQAPSDPGGGHSKRR